MIQSVSICYGKTNVALTSKFDVVFTYRWRWNARVFPEKNLFLVSWYLNTFYLRTHVSRPSQVNFSNKESWILILENYLVIIYGSWNLTWFIVLKSETHDFHIQVYIRNQGLRFWKNDRHCLSFDLWDQGPRAKWKGIVIMNYLNIVMGSFYIMLTFRGVLFKKYSFLSIFWPFLFESSLFLLFPVKSSGKNSWCLILEKYSVLVHEPWNFSWFVSLYREFPISWNLDRKSSGNTPTWM